MVAQLGYIPRTEQGAKLEVFKRSFSGWLSVPTEEIKLAQVLKLLLDNYKVSQTLGNLQKKLALLAVPTFYNCLIHLN